jgi:predicted amidohydrolase YtcJ
MIGRRAFVGGGLGAALLSGPAVRAWAQSAPPTLVLHNARITTQAGRDGQAIALREGLIQAVGSNRQIRALAGTGTRMLDLRGARVIPGLNDSHLHLTRQARFHNLELRWESVTSLDEGLRMIAEQAKRTPAGQWVRVVGGWSRAQMRERRSPTPEELNAAAPNTPVMVLFLYSEAILNRAGVQALGITSETRPPPPGKGMRYDIQPSGGAILRAEPYPQLLYKAIADLPALSPADQANSAQHWYRELNRLGLTSAVDAGGGGHLWPDDYTATGTLAEAGALPIRIGSYLFPQKAGEELAAFKGWTANERLAVNRAAELLEGFTVEGAGENLVASAGDYENFLSPRPELGTTMERDLTQVVEVLARAQWPIRLHATYDQSITRMLDVFEPVFKATGYRARWAFDHAETISPRNIARVRALGGGVSVQDRLAYAGELFAERYGAATAGDAPPLRALLAAGIPLGAGTDGTRVSGYNPWVALRWMTTGQTAAGTVLRPPSARLSRAQALRAFTIGSAWFSGDETRKGRLAPGQFADLAVLSEDYFSVPGERIAQIQSVLTVTGGRIVSGAGEFATLAPPLPPVSPPWSPVAHFGAR